MTADDIIRSPILDCQQSRPQNVTRTGTAHRRRDPATKADLGRYNGVVDWGRDGARSIPRQTPGSRCQHHAPTTRSYQTAVVDGKEMIIWVGANGTIKIDGARFDTAAGTWTPVTP